jgi:predicted RNase H-like HicB family nuclease
MFAVLAACNQDRDPEDEPHWCSSAFGCPSMLLLGPVLIYCGLMRLRLVVEHDSKTKRWAAFFPELPGCASAGDTEDEAIQNAKEALELWFEPTPVDLPAGAKVLEVALT